LFTSIAKSLIPTFDLAPERIDARLRARLSYGELIGLALPMMMTIGLLYLDPTGKSIGRDFRAHLAATHGEFITWVYPYWFLPLYSVLAALPFPVALALLNFTNLLGIWVAGRIFNGKTAIALLSYQTLFGMYYGQTVGILVGGLALMYLAMQCKRYWLAGAALTLALIKYQTAAPLALTLWLTDQGSLRDRLKVSVIPILIFAVSLIIYPLWPLNVVHLLSTGTFDTNASIVLWRWIGPISLILWLPVIAVPLSRGHRLVAVASATALAIPYMQQHDLLLLFLLPVGGIALLGNFGYLMAVIGFPALHMLVLIPLIMYGWVFVDFVHKWMRAASVQLETQQPEQI